MSRLRSLIVALAAVVACTAAGSMAAAAPAREHGKLTALRDAGASGPTLRWHVEFNGRAGSSPDTRQWQLMTGGGGWGNNELETYTADPANAHRARGQLLITAQDDGDGYTSARLMSRHSFRYGYLEARIKIPDGQGLWPAFWTLGADIRHGTQWPATGEIDIMEAISDMSFVAGSLHGTDTAAQYWWQGYEISNRITPPAGWTSSWHTYGIRWTASSITWYFDRQPYATVQRSDLAADDVWEFGKPHVVLLNLAVGGDWPGNPSAQTVFPATMRVDYVRLYSAVPTAG